MCRDQCRERVERSADHHDTRIRIEAPASGGNCFRIPVEREQTVPWSKGFHDARRMPAAAEGRIDVQAWFSGGRVERESRDCLLDKHRRVPSQCCVLRLPAIRAAGH